MYCYSPQPCIWPPPTHTFTGDSWTPTGQSPVGSLFLSPGSWCIRFCCALQESISQPYVSSGSSVVGLMETSSKRAYAIHTHTKNPCPCGRPLLTSTSTGLAEIVLSQSLWGSWSWCTQGLFEPSEPLWREQGLILNEFAPPAILLELLLCSWTWGSSSQPLQCLLSYWGFPDLERGVSPHGRWSWPWTWGVSSRPLSAPAPRSHAVVKCNQMTEFDQRNDSGNDVISVKMPKSRCAFFKLLLCSSYLMLHNKSPPNLKLWNNFIMLIASIA